jgi:hypothetical protein
MPEIIVRKILDDGIKELRTNKKAFNDLFSLFLQDELGIDYGPAYREKIWEWFTITKIPVVQAWSFDAQRIPCVSIHLANETEDESKAAIDDFAGTLNDEHTLGTGVFTVMVDIGIHANKGGDHVLWLYYIVSYILFKSKPAAFRLGLRLSTFSASDYSKDADKMANNIWTRWVRFRCTTQNFWGQEPLREMEEVNTATTIQGPYSCDIATSLDVDPATVDRRANKGIINDKVDDTNDVYDPFIDSDDDTV